MRVSALGIILGARLLSECRVQQCLTEERKSAYLVYRQGVEGHYTQEDLANLIWPVLPASN